MGKEREEKRQLREKRRSKRRNKIEHIDMTNLQKEMKAFGEQLFRG